MKTIDDLLNTAGKSPWNPLFKSAARERDFIKAASEPPSSGRSKFPVPIIRFVSAPQNIESDRPAAGRNLSPKGMSC